MTASGHDLRGKDVFDQIGAFMFSHGLEPTVANYSLLHQLVTGANPAVAKAVKEATSDGLRLTQKEADRILAETVGGETAPKGNDARAGFKSTVIEVQRQMAQFAGLVADTHAATRKYEQDLESSVGELIDGVQSLSELIKLTSRMIERTRAAESQLQTATGEANALREKLSDAQEEARRDPLTGLANRRAFEDHYGELARSGRSITMVVCDLDRFKLINDTHGHPVGDRVLKTVARTLEDAFQSHFVARYGGEEFVVVLADVDVGEAITLVDTARASLSDRRLKVRETDQPLGVITMSAGVAPCDGLDCSSAVARADALLYRAKQNGRDRVECEPVPRSRAA